MLSSVNSFANTYSGVTLEDGYPCSLEMGFSAGFIANFRYRNFPVGHGEVTSQVQREYERFMSGGGGEGSSNFTLKDPSTGNSINVTHRNSDLKLVSATLAKEGRFITCEIKSWRP